MATPSIQSRIRGLQSPSPRLAPASRRLTGASAPAIRPRINIVHAPKLSKPGALKPPKGKQYGILGGIAKAIKDVGSFPVTFARMAPTLIGKAGQSVYGFGESLFDIGADIVAPGAYTSRSEVDLEKGRKLGLTGPALLAYSMQRTAPLFAPIVESVPKTASRLAEIGTLGFVDTGAPGFDYYQALRSGELGNLLIEDIGNVMLAGRTAGLGSVAARAGGRLTTAGAPRLGTAVRRAGYFAEQPIGATVRGIARSTGRLAEMPRLTGRGSTLARNVGIAGSRISASETPLRSAVETAQLGYGKFAETKAAEKLAIKNAFDEQVRQQQQAGVEPSQQLLDSQKKAREDFDKWNKWTNEQRQLRKETKPTERSVEAISRTFTQLFASFEDKGAVPQRPIALRARARNLRKEAQRSKNPQAMLDEADYLDRKAEAKTNDTDNRFNDPNQKRDSFGAAVLIGSRIVDVVKEEFNAGRSIEDIAKIIIPDELPPSVKNQGYNITPGAVAKALAYVDGLADDIDNISVQEALLQLKEFSNFMTQQRQTGRGMVRGAASPLETGLLPLPEFIVIETEKPTSGRVGTQTLEFLDEAVAYVLQRYYPELARQLNLDLDNLQGLFKDFATAPKDSLQYLVAGMAVYEAFPIIRAEKNISKFLENPMIYPATSRPAMAARESGVRMAAGEDLRALVVELSRFNENNPGLLPQNLLKTIDDALQIAADPNQPFAKENWVAVSDLVNSVIKEIQKQIKKVEDERGTLAARTDKNWVRLDELAAVAQSAYGMIQTIIDQPELFADQAQVAEAGRLRGTAQGAQAGASQIDVFLEARQRTRGPVEGPKEFRVMPEIVRDSERLNAELVDAEAQLETARRDAEKAEQELVEIEAITPEEIARLEGERDIAIELEKEIPFTKVDKGEVDRQVAENIKDLERERIRLEDDFKSISKNPLLDRRDLREDLVSAIEEGLGAGKNSTLYKSFIRRWVAPLRASNPQTRRGGDPIPFGYDSVAMVIESSFNLVESGLNATAEAAWMELARRWARYQEIKKEVSELRRPEARESITKTLQDEADGIVDSELQRAYKENFLVDEAGFTRSSDDYNQIIEKAKNVEVSRFRSELLKRKVQELSDRIKQIGQELAVNRRELDDAMLRGEQRRLRGVEQRSTQQASLLESAALKGQRETVKARQKGVGRVVEGEPRLQRQFERPLLAEQDRLLKRQQDDWAKMKQMRAEQAAKEQALAEAQTIPEAGGRQEARLARPLLAEIGGETPLYIPAGASRATQQRSVVPKTLRAEGPAAETVGGFEKTRTGTVLPMTAGQMSARVREILQVWGRNVVIQAIINNKNFVSTLADRIPPEVRQRFMEEAEQIVANDPRLAVNPKVKENLVKAEYQKKLFEELERQGLDPISPVEMPDPADPYAERAALKALDEVVSAQDLTDTTLVMSKNMRAGLASQFEPKDISRGYSRLNDAFMFVREKTGSWKSVILPFSVRWQVGDHISNVLNAWVRGDIPPTELYAQMRKTLETFRDESGMTKRRLMIGEGLESYMANPLAQTLESMGLQGSGLKAQDVRVATQGTLRPQSGVFESRAFLPGFRKKAFAFNEFQNRLARHAVATKKLTDILEAQGRTIDEISPVNVASDDVLRAAVEEAVASANDTLGNFSELSPYERQVVRTIFPFWSWIKFINKAAAELLIDQPDRVLFMSHLGALTMEENAEGMWEWLKGQTETPGLGFVDLRFINPYSDAALFTRDPFSSVLEQGTSVSPVINYGLTAIGETAYGLSGNRLPFVPTLSRPGYLEGRRGETTRTAGDVVGGLGYKFVKDFGGPLRNIFEVLPSRIPIIAPEGRLLGTDVMVGPGPRYPQGSPRTTGAYGIQRLSPTMARTSALLRTFGLPGPSISSDVAQRVAAENVQSARRALLRRINERRLANR